jgi:hypothetical protein
MRCTIQRQKKKTLEPHAVTLWVVWFVQYFFEPFMLYTREIYSKSLKGIFKSNHQIRFRISDKAHSEILRIYSKNPICDINKLANMKTLQWTGEDAKK